MKWPLLLGAAGFAAGFFGPMVFVPDANQGPLVGIFISGPAGVALGLLMWGLCSLLGLSATAQWRLLKGLAVAGVLAVLLTVQPRPALRGYVMDLEVVSCETPMQRTPQVIDYWTRRVAGVTWAAPRPGWQQDMRDKLARAPGVVLEVEVRDQHSVYEGRAPWNRGRLSATAGRNAPEETAFYDAGGSCEDYPAGRGFTAFEHHGLNGSIQPPEFWPPADLAGILPVSPIVEVPERFAGLQR